MLFRHFWQLVRSALDVRVPLFLLLAWYPLIQLLLIDASAVPSMRRGLLVLAAANALICTFAASGVVAQRWLGTTRGWSSAELNARGTLSIGGTTLQIVVVTAPWAITAALSFAVSWDVLAGLLVLSVLSSAGLGLIVQRLRGRAKKVMDALDRSADDGSGIPVDHASHVGNTPTAKQPPRRRATHEGHYGG